MSPTQKNIYVRLDNDELMTLNQLASVPGISIFLRGVNISKSAHKFPFNVAIHYPKEHHDMPIDEGWMSSVVSMRSSLINPTLTAVALDGLAAIADNIPLR